MIAKCSNAWFLKFEEHAPSVSALYSVQCTSTDRIYNILHIDVCRALLLHTQCAEHGAIEEEALTFVFYSTFCKMCTLVRHIVATRLNCINSSLIHARAQWLKILSPFFYLAFLPNLFHLVGKITFSQKANQIQFTNGKKNSERMKSHFDSIQYGEHK